MAKLFVNKELAHASKVMGRPITVADDVMNWIVRRGYTKRLGARPMRRAVEKSIPDALHAWESNTGAERLAEGYHGVGLTLHVSEDQERLEAKLKTKG